MGLCVIAQTQDRVVKKSTDTIIVTPLINAVDAGQRFVPKLKKEKFYKPDTTHSPSLAVRRSLLIPGRGQLYNKKGAWWKIPAIYAGLGSLGYSIATNQQGYIKYLAFYRLKNFGQIPVAGDALYATHEKYKAEYTPISGQSLAYFQEGTSNYQRNFQISILGVIAVWGIQAIEAYVEAKFISSFSVDNDLSIKVGPGFTNDQTTYVMLTTNNAYTPGAKVTFTFR